MHCGLSIDKLILSGYNNGIYFIHISTEHVFIFVIRSLLQGCESPKVLRRLLSRKIGWQEKYLSDTFICILNNSNIFIFYKPIYECDSTQNRNK